MQTTGISIFSLTFAAVLGVSAVVADAACYNPQPDRDKFLGGWVQWIPAKGEKAEWKGKSYNRNQAVKVAKADIIKGFAGRGGDAQKSPATVAAFAVMEAGGVNARAARKYARAKMDPTFEDAVSCWAGYAK